MEARVHCNVADVEEHVRFAVLKLSQIENKHRPSTPERLASFLRQRSCCRISLALQGVTPGAFAAALLPRVKDDRELHSALEPLANETSMRFSSALLSPGKSPDAKKRARLDTEGVVNAAASQAAGRLHHSKHHFTKLTLLARMSWLQSQAKKLSSVEPALLVSSLAKRGIIQIEEARVVYDDSVLTVAARTLTSQQLPPENTEEEANMPQAESSVKYLNELLDFSCPIRTVEVDLGNGCLGADRAAAAREGTRSMLARWRSAALSSPQVSSCGGVTPQCVDPLTFSLSECAKEVGHRYLKLGVRIASTPTGSYLFCTELRRLAEASVLEIFSPIQIQIDDFPLRNAKWTNEWLMVSEKLKDSTYFKVELKDGDGMTINTDPTKGNQKGKGTGKGHQDLSFHKAHAKPCTALLLTFPRDSSVERRADICDAIKIIVGRKPAFTMEVPRRWKLKLEKLAGEVLNELLDRVASDQQVSLELDRDAFILKIWPSVHMLLACVASEGGIKNKKKGKGKGKGKGKQKVHKWSIAGSDNLCGAATCGSLCDRLSSKMEMAHKYLMDTVKYELSWALMRDSGSVGGRHREFNPTGSRSRSRSRSCSRSCSHGAKTPPTASGAKEDEENDTSKNKEKEEDEAKDDGKAEKRKETEDKDKDEDGAEKKAKKEMDDAAESGSSIAIASVTSGTGGGRQSCLRRRRSRSRSHGLELPPSASCGTEAKNFAATDASSTSGADTAAQYPHGTAAD